MGGASAAATFAFLSLGRAIQGVYANAEHFVLIAVMGGVLLLRSGAATGVPRVAAAGVCFGLATLLKQHGVVFAGLGAVVLWIDLARVDAPRGVRIARLAIFGVSVAAPIGLVVLALAAAGDGVLGRFWFWVVEYAAAYGGHMSLPNGLRVLGITGPRVLGESPQVWALVVAGGFAVPFHRRVRRHAPFLYAFALFSVLAVCPGWNFRPHYFLLLLPAAALFAGALVTAAQAALARRLAPVTAGGVAAAMLVAGLGVAAREGVGLPPYASPADVDRSTSVGRLPSRPRGTWPNSSGG